MNGYYQSVRRYLTRIQVNLRSAQTQLLQTGRVVQAAYKGGEPAEYAARMADIQLDAMERNITEAATALAACRRLPTETPMEGVPVLELSEPEVVVLSEDNPEIPT